jgi:peptidyl-tRNA hydrolase
VISRRDLRPGQQAVQAMHAAIDFCFQHTEEAREWQSQSNYLAVLSVADEPALFNLIEKLEKRGIRYTAFREPDLNNEVTAVAVEPHADLRKITSGFPLLLKEYGPLV